MGSFEFADLQREARKYVDFLKKFEQLIPGQGFLSGGTYTGTPTTRTDHSSTCILSKQPSVTTRRPSRPTRSILYNGHRQIILVVTGC